MTQPWAGDGPASRDQPVTFDTSVAHIAWVYDYWLGGKDNFAADRELAEQFMAADPAVTAGVRRNRAFLGRAVHYLAARAGIRQFLDIGTGIPAANNTYEVAQRAAPSARVVYVDNDRCKSGCAHAGVPYGGPVLPRPLGADTRECGDPHCRALQVELPVADACREGVPLLRSQGQHRAVLVLAVPHGDDAGHVRGDLYTRAAAVAEARLLPRHRTR